MKINSHNRSAIQSAQLRQLFNACYVSLITSTALAFILAYMQRKVIADSIVTFWLVSVVFVAVLRAFLVRAYHRLGELDEAAVKLWLTKFRIGAIAVGIAWGSSGILLFPDGDILYQLFLIFMLAGLSSGGVVAYSADVFCAIVFSSTILLPISFRLFIAGEQLSMAMGVAGFLYFGFMMLNFRHIHRGLTENIVLHLEAKAREEEIRLSEERYRLLLNHSPVGIFHFDVDLAVTYCNERFADLVELSADEIVGTNLRAFSDQFLVPLAASALTGKVMPFEGQFCSAMTKSRFWIEVNCAPSRNVSGAIIGGVAVVRDVTEKKEAEEMLRISAIAFESQSAMIVTDPDGIILRVNQAFTDLTGYSAEEALGKTPHMLNSGRHDKSFYQNLWSHLKQSGSWQGEIWNRRKNGMVYAEWLTVSAVTAPEGRVTHYVGTYSDITENQDAVAEIHRLAYYDPLTHLPNRRLLEDRLGQALLTAGRTGLYGAILFLDLDDFKTLNDTRGHDAGDQLLIEVARRLSDAVRDSDIVGRLGGDEFVVLLHELSQDAEIAALQTKQVGEKLLDALAAPYHFEDYEFYCTASIGIRLYRDHGVVEELLRHADLAMYKAKRTGGKSMCFFDPTMQTKVTARAEMEKDLRRALEQDQFKLFFQSQVSGNSQIVGAEVLLRWQHPDKGLVSPIDFIPLAEKTWLILPIGQWVLDTVCLQLKEWERNSQTRDVQLSVNVSTRQFRKPDFVEHIQKALSSNTINPDLLKLELTESLVLDNINDTIVKMHALRELGVRFSLDDFGTGYSSFSYLTQLPLDQLKIDRSFVRNIGVKTNDAIIVQTIIGMAHNLGIEVIAEGVETEVQRSFLEEHGCPRWQGYLFSKPVPINEFEGLLGQTERLAG